MNKAEYKRISHDIRYAAFRDARYRTEKPGKSTPQEAYCIT